ncbi:MAG TPA: 3-dehydroquinate synthase [Candidatus Binatia bacterium]|jgi:3-dehydroquinate synthase
MMPTLTVALGDRSYPIFIGADVLEQTGELLRSAELRGKVAVLTNPTVAALYLDSIRESLGRAGFEPVPIIVGDGEQYKDLKTLGSIYDRLVAERLERRDCILALGGGVIGDLAGFAAATYLRGVRYVQIPTTLLAQVDSSVGGKTAVNHHDGKNLIGAFYQPRLVVMDVLALRTLPSRELVAGLAEVIKYGVIEDAELFDLLEKEIQDLIALDTERLRGVIATCCSIKARVVEVDEREDDYRAVLNFGHTVGHALEAVTGYNRFLHGEAVAIGMVKAAEISAQQGFCGGDTVERIRGLVRKAGLPIQLPTDISRQDLVGAMEHDKKSAAGSIKFVMCAGIGKTSFHRLIPAEILKALEA